MFGVTSPFKAAAFTKLRELQAAYDALDKAHAEFIKQTESLRNRAFLVDIRTEGRVNKLMFVRNGSPYVVETYSLMADDVTGWREALL